ncbi:hypothetical protein DL764_010004 [Monosporascus ibericus]|uniref:Uncharacterized protein n=1 Tax=Monosporascus ibericus TaxID=155417 RepID=A0A4Q4SWI4_9PEZI|nr:hypothetical protein DL764_010004 [Monosporascus ibericus]
MVRAPPAVQDQGEVIPNPAGGSKYRCTIPKADGQPCGTVISNTKGSISSHRKIHDPNSAYNREAEKFDQPIPCQQVMADGTLCGAALTSKHTMLRHYGSQHRHSGKKELLFAKYGV